MIKDNIFSFLPARDQINDVNKINDRGFLQRFLELLGDDYDENYFFKIRDIIQNVINNKTNEIKFVEFWVNQYGFDWIFLFDDSEKRKLSFYLFKWIGRRSTLIQIELMFKYLLFTEVSLRSYKDFNIFDNPYLTFDIPNAVLDKNQYDYDILLTKGDLNPILTAAELFPDNDFTYKKYLNSEVDLTQSLSYGIDHQIDFEFKRESGDNSEVVLLDGTIIVNYNDSTDVNYVRYLDLQFDNILPSLIEKIDISIIRIEQSVELFINSISVGTGVVTSTTPRIANKLSDGFNFRLGNVKIFRDNNLLVWWKINKILDDCIQDYGIYDIDSNLFQKMLAFQEFNEPAYANFIRFWVDKRPIAGVCEFIIKSSDGTNFSGTIEIEGIQYYSFTTVNGEAIIYHTTDDYYFNYTIKGELFDDESGTAFLQNDVINRTNIIELTRTMTINFTGDTIGLILANDPGLGGTDLTIDWGDTNEDTLTATATQTTFNHTYSVSGTYDITITGNLTYLDFAT